MNSNQKLSYAIAAILSGSGAGLGLAHADPAVDTAAVESEGIQEIVVTAQRRDGVDPERAHHDSGHHRRRSSIS